MIIMIRRSGGQLDLALKRKGNLMGYYERDTGAYCDSPEEEELYSELFNDCFEDYLTEITVEDYGMIGVDESLLPHAIIAQWYVASGKQGTEWHNLGYVMEDDEVFLADCEPFIKWLAGRFYIMYESQDQIEAYKVVIDGFEEWCEKKSRRD
jgi:hypothetical protein